MNKHQNSTSIPKIIIGFIIGSIIGAILIVFFLNFRYSFFTKHLEETYDISISYDNTILDGTIDYSLAELSIIMDYKNFTFQDNAAKCTWKNVIIYRNSKTSEHFPNSFTLYFPDGTSITKPGKIVKKGIYAVMFQTNEGIYITSLKNITED